MPRTKGGFKTRQRHKRLLKRAKGNFGARRKLFSIAKETVDKGLNHAFAGRKENKRQYRSLWTTRINAAARTHDLSYSRLIAGLKRAKIELDRRVLADLAVTDPKAFAEIATAARQAL